MKYSGIGGQAVLEGVMMRNKDKYAVAVRKPNKEIEVKVSDFKSISNKYAILTVPLLRGIVNFVESLYIGMKALSFSSELFEEEEEKPKKKKSKNKKDEKDTIMTAIVVSFSIMMAIGVFMILPYGISLLFSTFIHSPVLLTILEGIIRFIILVAYMVGISFVPDIKRVYMYHGAEHKAINCVEEGFPLTVENVRRMTRKHLRCGTGFIVNVIILSIILFMFIRVENILLRLLFRIILVPVIAAFAYEFLRLAGTSNHPVVNFLSIPGLWFQGLTTKEPDNKMIEVAIRSIEAVFDWQKFLNEDKMEGLCCGNELKEAKQEEKFASGVEEEESEVKEWTQSEIQRQKLIRDKEKTKIESLKPKTKVALDSIEEDEEDEILNALDKFFNSHKLDEKNSEDEK